MGPWSTRVSGCCNIEVCMLEGERREESEEKKKRINSTPPPTHPSPSPTNKESGLFRDCPDQGHVHARCERQKGKKKANHGIGGGFRRGGLGLAHLFVREGCSGTVQIQIQIRGNVHANCETRRKKKKCSPCPFATRTTSCCLMCATYSAPTTGPPSPEFAERD